MMHPSFGGDYTLEIFMNREIKNNYADDKDLHAKGNLISLEPLQEIIFIPKRN